jgi:hypothetical protein
VEYESSLMTNVLAREQVRIPLNVDTEEPHDCSYGGIVNSNKDNRNGSKRNKDDIINITKAVARKSTLMQITRVKAANGFH